MLIIVDVNLRCTKYQPKKVAHVFFVFFSVCFEQSMSFLLHPTKIVAKESARSPWDPPKFCGWIRSLGFRSLPSLKLTAKAPWKWGPPGSLERNLLEPIIFRCELLVSGRVVVFLGGETSNIYSITFTPKIGEDCQFDKHMFWMGWNHQLEMN